MIEKSQASLQQPIGKGNKQSDVRTAREYSSKLFLDVFFQLLWV